MTAPVRLYVDDIRNPGPELGDGWDTDWTVARTSREAIAILEQGNVVELTLDHDLGGNDTGYKVICWIEEHNVWPADGVFCHSANPVGWRRIMDVVKRHHATLSPEEQRKREFYA